MWRRWFYGVKLVLSVTRKCLMSDLEWICPHVCFTLYLIVSNNIKKSTHSSFWVFKRGNIFIDNKQKNFC